MVFCWFLMIVEWVSNGFEVASALVSLVLEWFKHVPGR